MPVLVAFGEDDLILELDSAYAFFARNFRQAPSVERVAIPNAGHFPMEQESEVTARAIVGFLRQTATAASSASPRRSPRRRTPTNKDF